MKKKSYDLSVLAPIRIDHICRVSRQNGDGTLAVEERLPPHVGDLPGAGLRGIRCIPGKLTAAGVVGDDADGDRAIQECANLGLDVRFVQKAPRRRTSRRYVYRASDSQFVVLDEDIKFDDLPEHYFHSALIMAAQSRGLLVGDVPGERTSRLAEWCAEHRVLFAVAPGNRQLARVADVPCDVLILSHQQARTAMQLSDTATPEETLEQLIERTPARRIVQTGGADHPTLLFERAASRRWIVRPAVLSRLAPEGKPVASCDTDAIIAAAVVRSLIEGHSLDVAYGKWGRVLATAHQFQLSFQNVTAVDQWYAAHAEAFPTVRDLLPAAAQAA